MIPLYDLTTLCIFTLSLRIRHEALSRLLQAWDLAILQWPVYRRLLYAGIQRNTVCRHKVLVHTLFMLTGVPRQPAKDDTNLNYPIHCVPYLLILFLHFHSFHRFMDCLRIPAQADEEFERAAQVACACVSVSQVRSSGEEIIEL